MKTECSIFVLTSRQIGSRVSIALLNLVVDVKDVVVVKDAQIIAMEGGCV